MSTFLRRKGILFHPEGAKTICRSNNHRFWEETTFGFLSFFITDASNPNVETLNAPSGQIG